MTLRRLLPRTFGVVGIVASWKAMADDPVLLCPCQEGDWCQWCEPLAAQSACSVEASHHLLPAA